MARPSLKDLPRPKAPYRPHRDADVPDGEPNWFSKKKAQLEDAQRRRILDNTSDLSPAEADAAKALLARYDAAQRDGSAPDSLAWAQGGWDLRNRTVGALWKLVDAYGPERSAFVTLRPQGMLVEGRDLADLDPRRLRRNLRNHLDRAGVTTAGGFLILGLDAEFDTNRGEGGLYDWHWHGIAGGEKLDLIDGALRQRRNFKNDREHPLEAGLSKSPRVKIQRGMVNLPTPLAYGFKSWVPFRPTYRSPEGELLRDKTKRRIPSPYFQRWMLWMDRWNLDDLVLRNGLDITKAGFRITM